jgi:hypothetical protein
MTGIQRMTYETILFSITVYMQCLLNLLALTVRFLMTLFHLRLQNANHSNRASQRRGSWPLEYWHRGFESHSRHGSLFSSFCVVLPCVSTDNVTDQPLLQGVLPTVEKSSEIWEKEGAEFLQEHCSNGVKLSYIVEWGGKLISHEQWEIKFSGRQCVLFQDRHQNRRRSLSSNATIQI